MSIRSRSVIVLLLFCAASLAQAQFLPYREFFFRGQPSGTFFDSLGFKRSHGVYENEVTGGTPPVKEALVRSRTRATRTNYSLYEDRMWFDIEYLNTDAVRIGVAQATANAESLAKYIGWAKDEEPTLQVGIFSVVPVTDVNMSSRLARRQAANDVLQFLADTLDFLCPALYLYYSEQKKPYASYAVPMVAEARRMAKGKKVFPFIAPGYHPAGDFKNQYASHDVWKNVLRVIRDSAKADGFIMFAGVNAMGSQPADWAYADTTGWWQATLEFMAELRGEPPPPPPPPAAPSIVTPTGGATIEGTSLTIRWRKVAGASRYHLQVSESQTFTNLLVNDSTLTDTLQLMSSLRSGASYYIRARARGIASWSGYSSTVHFSTITPAPLAPSVIAPLAGSTITPPTVAVRWRAVPGAVKYQVQISGDSGFQSNVFNDSTVTDTVRQVTGLMAASSFYVRVRAKGLHLWGNYSATVHFSTAAPPPPSAPSMLMPMAGAIVNSTTLQARWRGISGAVAYHLQLSESATFASNMVNDTTVTDTTYRVTGLKPGTGYFARIRTKGPHGWGSFGLTVPFSISSPAPAAPLIVWPPPGSVITTSSFTARWRRVSNATKYHLQVDDNVSFSTPLVNDSTLSDSLRVVGSLQSGAFYYIRVRAKGTSSWSAFGPVVQISTPVPRPAPPPLIVPNPGAVVLLPVMTVLWRNVPGAVAYHLQLTENPAFLGGLVNDSTITDTVRQVGGLRDGASYHLRMRSKGISGWGVFGDTVRFTTSAALSVTMLNEVPRVSYLAQNFPNPFNPVTIIRFGLSSASQVRLEVYDALGQRVRQVVDDNLGAGTYDVMFDASGLASGLYIYRIRTEHFVDSRRLVLLK